MLGSRLSVGLQRASRFMAALTAAAGLAVLAGWALGLESFTSSRIGIFTSKANFAAASMFAGAALLLLHARRHYAASLTLSALVTAIGAATSCEYFFGIDLGIDRILFADRNDPTSPGRMSHMAAFNTTLFGLALLSLHSPSVPAISTCIGCLASLLSFLSLVGYANGVDFFREMALLTGLVMITFSVALVFTRPDEGPMRILSSDTPGGAMARRILPVTIFLPPIIGYFRLLGERAGLYHTEFGVSLSVITSVNPGSVARGA